MTTITITHDDGRTETLTGEERRGPMTLGELRAALERMPRTALLCFKPFAGLHFGGIDSWRGIYSEPAVSYVTSDYDSAGKRRDVQAALVELDAVLGGRGHCGYKDHPDTKHVFHAEHEARVDNWGECGEAAIFGVEARDEWVVWLVVGEVER